MRPSSRRRRRCPARLQRLGARPRSRRLGAPPKCWERTRRFLTYRTLSLARCRPGPLRSHNPQGMAVIDSRIDVASPEFACNREYFVELLEQLRARTATVMQGGGSEAMAKHVARNKLPARERIERLVD